MQVPVAFFFDGLADPMSDAEASANDGALILAALVMTADGLELAELFPRIGEARVPRQVLALVKAMAAD